MTVQGERPYEFMGKVVTLEASHCARPEAPIPTFYWLIFSAQEKKK